MEVDHAARAERVGLRRHRHRQDLFDLALARPRRGAQHARADGDRMQQPQLLVDH